MMTEFDMTDLGKMSYFLGLEVLQRSEGIYVSQWKYAQEVLERFNMNQCNTVHNPIVSGFKMTKDEGRIEIDSTLYKRIVGSLMYLTAMRPDMMYVISLISRFMERPTELYFKESVEILEGGRHHDQAFEAGRVLEFKGVIGCLSTHGYKLIADSIQFKGGC